MPLHPVSPPIRASDIRRLPIEHHFQTRADGEAYSEQCLTVPTAWLPAATLPPGALRALGPLYFRQLSRLTWGLIHAREKGGQVGFELFGFLPLLGFGTPHFDEAPEGGQACYPLTSGLMLAPDAPQQGELCLTMRRTEGGLRLCMRVERYYPRIVGTGHPSRLRRLLYEWTQATLHRWIAYQYLRHLVFTLVEGRLGEKEEGTRRV